MELKWKYKVGKPGMHELTTSMGTLKVWEFPVPQVWFEPPGGWYLYYGENCFLQHHKDKEVKWDNIPAAKDGAIDWLIENKYANVLKELNILRTLYAEDSHEESP